MGMVALPAGILASAFSDQQHRRREAYREKPDDVLEDGIVTEEEVSELLQLRKELGLSEQEATRLQRHLTKVQVLAACPHCGQSKLLKLRS